MGCEQTWVVVGPGFGGDVRIREVVLGPGLQFKRRERESCGGYGHGALPRPLRLYAGKRGRGRITGLGCMSPSEIGSAVCVFLARTPKLAVGDFGGEGAQLSDGVLRGGFKACRQSWKTASGYDAAVKAGNIDAATVWMDQYTTAQAKMARLPSNP